MLNRLLLVTQLKSFYFSFPKTKAAPFQKWDFWGAWFPQTKCHPTPKNKFMGKGKVSKQTSWDQQWLRIKKVFEPWSS